MLANLHDQLLPRSPAGGIGLTGLSCARCGQTPCLAFSLELQSKSAGSCTGGAALPGQAGQAASFLAARSRRLPRLRA